MRKYDMGLASIVEDTERTKSDGRTDVRTSDVSVTIRGTTDPIVML